MERLYSYVGPETLRTGVQGAPAGTPIRSRAALRTWLQAAPAALHEGATFVLDAHSVLRLAPRSSEHVACAGGGPVRAAGELRFSKDGAELLWSSNQSSGYCPEPRSFAVLAAVLQRLGILAAPGYSAPCIWRRCPACAQINLVKEEDYRCACCEEALPALWNFALDPPLCPELRLLRDAAQLELGPAGFAQAPPAPYAALQGAKARGAALQAEAAWVLHHGSPGGRLAAALLLAGIEEAAGRAAWVALQDDEGLLALNRGGGGSYHKVLLRDLAREALEGYDGPRPWCGLADGGI